MEHENAGAERDVSNSDKDTLDLAFLRHWFAERGQEPPAVAGPARGL